MKSTASAIALHCLAMDLGLDIMGHAWAGVWQAEKARPSGKFMPEGRVREKVWGKGISSPRFFLME